MSQPRALPWINPDVVFSPVSDGAVLLSTDREVYYGLNEVAATVWTGLEQAESLEGLCGRVSEAYPDADPETIREDVVELLADLERHGLVRFPASRELA